jgi:hypothetical protein
MRFPESFPLRQKFRSSEERQNGDELPVTLSRGSSFYSR